MLVIGCLPELLMEVSTDNTVKTETHSKRESVVNLRLLRRAVDSDLFDARPTTRVLLDNRFLQSLPPGPRTAVSSFHAEKPWHQQVVGCLSDVYARFVCCRSLLAVRSVWQHYSPTREVLGLLEVFRRMVNESIRIGLANDVSSLRKLSLLSYNQLAQYDSPSCYKLCAISRAAGILASRKKSLRRGLPSRTPYAVRQQLVSCYVFKTRNGGLEIPIARGKRLSIPLTKHTLNMISQPRVKVRSFTLTRNRLSLCISRDVAPIECASTVGVDRNLRNLTVGNEEETRHYDLSETVRMASTTVRIVASFRRDDSRIRTGIASRYGMRRTARTGHLLHVATKTIVAA